MSPSPLAWPNSWIPVLSTSFASVQGAAFGEGCPRNPAVGGGPATLSNVKISALKAISTSSFTPVNAWYRTRVTADGRPRCCFTGLQGRQGRGECPGPWICHQPRHRRFAPGLSPARVQQEPEDEDRSAELPFQILYAPGRRGPPRVGHNGSVCVCESVWAQLGTIRSTPAVLPRGLSSEDADHH